MFAAIIFLSVVQPMPDAIAAPNLPPGSSPALHRAFNLIEEELSKKKFDAAKAKTKLLPDLTIVYSWNDQNVPAESRSDWAAARDRAFKTMAGRIPGLNFKEGAHPALKFSMEKSLAKDPVSGFPKGITVSYSEDLNKPRMEAIIGVQRGNPLEATSASSVHNEVAYAVGAYLGLGDGPAPMSVMGRLDYQMQYITNPDITELNTLTAISEAIKQLKGSVEKKEVLTIAQPKASFNPMKIERGPVIQGTPVEFSIEVNNQGNAPLVFRVVPDCGCITAGAAAPAQPGASSTVTIRIDTSNIVGELNKHLVLVSNDINQPVQKFPIHIKTKSRFRFLTTQPGVLVTGDEGIDTEIFFTSPKEKPLEVTSIQVVGNSGTATFEAWQGDMADPDLNEPSQPRQGYKIKMHIDPPQADGRSVATLLIKTKDTRYETLRYPVFIQKGIATLPSSVFFGDLNTTEREASLILTRPNKPFKITKITSDSSFITAEVENLRDNWEYRVVVRYNGKAPAGEVRGTITLETDDPKQGKISIPVAGLMK